jgi:hypothetical protein
MQQVLVIFWHQVEHTEYQECLIHTEDFNERFSTISGK